MTIRTYSILAGVIGSAVGAWFWNRQRAAGSTSTARRGTVIYDNTPTASPVSGEGII